MSEERFEPDHQWHSCGVEGDTYYDILGASSASSLDEIRAKHRKLIQMIHPDLDGPVALFRQVQAAYEVLSDPVRRSAYDRSLEVRTRTSPGERKEGPPRERASRETPGRSSSNSNFGSERSSGTRPSTGSTRSGTSQNVTTDTVHSFVRHYPARAAAIAGAGLLALGAALGPIGQGVLLLGVVVLLLAAVAGLGARGVKEYEAYKRSGMAAIDGMTGRQFALLLEHYFASKGYRVARLGASGDVGADLLLNDSHGRTVVQLKRWHGVVHHDAVQQAALAMAHYGVARALVVTSSNYSQHAVTVANSNGVTLWNRANLAVELAALPDRLHQSGLVQFTSDLRAGARICLGFVATLLVVIVAACTASAKTAIGRAREMTNTPQ